MVDMVVSRLEMKETLARLLKILLKEPAVEIVPESEIMPPASSVPASAIAPQPHA